MRKFNDGPVDGVLLRPLKKHHDSRGWLCELFRGDNDLLPGGFLPEMAYFSMTRPGGMRGPHAHREQTDYFCFFGPSDFQLVIWDDREGSPTCGKRLVAECGEDNPCLALVPPLLVHAYRNIGAVEGLVFNAPDRLYAGRGRKEPVDEIRYEEIAGHPYIMP